MTDVPAWAQPLVNDQQRMNKTTWEELVRQGLTEDTLVQLEFLYVAPGRPEAERLEAFLFRESDYAIQVVEDTHGPLRRKSYGVVGNTKLTKVSPQILDQWVDYMVTAGAVFGGCRFDGWGTQLDRRT